jgi:hypothetical protein
MLTRRSALLMIPSGVLALAALPPRVGRATEVSPAARAWLGVYLGAISPAQESQLGTALRAFFGKSEGDVASFAAPDAGPSLFNQFASVDYGFRMWSYRLPSGRVIWQRNNAGVDAIVVPQQTSGTVTIAAAAMLTHLCPKSGVDEDFPSHNGGTYQQHFRCQLDHSLVIFYPQGGTPDPELNEDLTKWARTSINTRPVFPVVSPVRKLILKRFVRVLDK